MDFIVNGNRNIIVETSKIGKNQKGNISYYAKLIRKVKRGEKK